MKKRIQVRATRRGRNATQAIQTSPTYPDTTNTRNTQIKKGTRANPKTQQVGGEITIRYTDRQARNSLATMKRVMKRSALSVQHGGQNVDTPYRPLQSLGRDPDRCQVTGSLRDVATGDDGVGPPAVRGGEIDWSVLPPRRIMWRQGSRRLVRTKTSSTDLERPSPHTYLAVYWKGQGEPVETLTTATSSERTVGQGSLDTATLEASDAPQPEYPNLIDEMNRPEIYGWWLIPRSGPTPSRVIVTENNIQRTKKPSMTTLRANFRCLLRASSLNHRDAV